MKPGKYEVLLLTLKILIATLPLAYFAATVYIPYQSNPGKLEVDKQHVQSTIEDNRITSKRQVAEKTSLSLLQSWYVMRELEVRTCYGQFHVGKCSPYDITG